jgi:hypothetical protein
MHDFLHKYQYDPASPFALQLLAKTARLLLSRLAECPNPVQQLMMVWHEILSPRIAQALVPAAKALTDFLGMLAPTPCPSRLGQTHSNAIMKMESSGI